MSEPMPPTSVVPTWSPTQVLIRLKVALTSVFESELVYPTWQEMKNVSNTEARAKVNISLV